MINPFGIYDSSLFRIHLIIAPMTISTLHHIPSPLHYDYIIAPILIALCDQCWKGCLETFMMHSAHNRHNRWCHVHWSCRQLIYENGGFLLQHLLYETSIIRTIYQYALLVIDLNFICHKCWIWKGPWKHLPWEQSFHSYPGCHLL